MNRAQLGIKKLNKPLSWVVIPVLAFLFIACDPNNFDPQLVNQLTNRAALAPTENSRIAFLACDGALASTINPRGVNSQNPSINPLAQNATVQNTAAFFVLGVNPTNALPFSRQRLGAPRIDGGRTGFYASIQRINVGQIDSRPRQAVFTPSGGNVMVTLDDGVAAFSVNPRGLIRHDLYSRAMSNPGPIAAADITFDDGTVGSFFFVADQDRDSIFIYDATTPTGLLDGSRSVELNQEEVPVLRNNLIDIQDLGVGYDEHGDAKLYVVANGAANGVGGRGTVGGIYVADVLKMLNERPIEYQVGQRTGVYNLRTNHFSVDLVDPAMAEYGFEYVIRSANTQPDLIAINPQGGFPVWNDVFGPRTIARLPDGRDTLVNFQFQSAQQLSLVPNDTVAAGEVQDLAFSPNGNVVIGLLRDGFLAWNPVTGRAGRKVSFGGGDHSQIAIDPSGEFALATNRGGSSSSLSSTGIVSDNGDVKLLRFKGSRRANAGRGVGWDPDDLALVGHQCVSPSAVAIQPKYIRRGEGTYRLPDGRGIPPRTTTPDPNLLSDAEGDEQGQGAETAQPGDPS